MVKEEILRSSCRCCSAGCGVFLHVKDDRVVKIEGIPDCVPNEGTICAKGALAQDVLYAKDRQLYPLKRIGARGGGKFERITWDEALDTIATRLNGIKAKYGARSYVHLVGQQWHWVVGLLLNARFCGAFGSVNVACHIDQCFGPPSMGMFTTYGFPYGGYLISRPGMMNYDDHPTKCMMFWGANPFTSRVNRARKILDAKERGAKIIMPDPYFSSMAQKADIWLQLKPGTDIALALAMINVIIKEELYDKDFVEKWCFGFDKLAKHVENYTPEAVEKITWVPADKTRAAARMYATNKPAMIEDYVGISEMHDGWGAHRCCSILRAITGNLDIKGGDVALPIPSHLKKLAELSLLTEVAKTGQKPFSWKNYPLMSDWAMMLVTPALPGQLLKAIANADPYPIKAMMVVGANPVSTVPPNRKDWEQALKDPDKLEFLVVNDLFMTGTAKHADIFLPAAWWPEVRDLSEHDPYVSYALLKEPVKPAGECRPVVDWILDLAKRMGMEELMPWKNADEVINDLYKPFNVEELNKNPSGMFAPGYKIPDSIIYRKYDTQGFRFGTPSGKVELYSQMAEDAGADPLPVYRDYTETLAKETGLSSEKIEADYPLLLTKHNTYVYAHSQYRLVPLHREIEPGPVLEMHPETAKKLDIRNGDEVLIESPFGAVKSIAELTERAHPGVVFMLHGWDLGYGADGTADTNHLTGRTRMQVLGAVPNRAIRVRVRRA